MFECFYDLNIAHRQQLVETYDVEQVIPRLRIHTPLGARGVRILGYISPEWRNLVQTLNVKKKCWNTEVNPETFRIWCKSRNVFFK